MTPKDQSYISSGNERRLRFILAGVTFFLLFTIYSIARECLCPFGADRQRSIWRLTGDEPRYLLTAQALASGHGEDISRVHAAQTYTNFWWNNKPIVGAGHYSYDSFVRFCNVRFRFDRREAWGDRQIIHGGILEPLLCAPFALSPTRPRWKILLVQGLLAAAMGALLVASSPGGRDAAILQSATTVFFLGSAPVVFYTAQIYPETIMGALLLMFLLFVRHNLIALRCIGHACLFLSLFGSSRIAGAAFAAELFCLARAFRERRWAEVFIILLGASAYFGYHVWRWGNFYPPNTDIKSPITPALLPRGFLRYIFGNSCGMIPLCPVAWVGLVALIPLLSNSRHERMAIPCAIISLGIALSVAMFPTFRAGRCAAGRYQVACIWALLPAVLYSIDNLPRGSRWGRRIRFMIWTLGPVTLALAIWLAVHPRWWHEYFHPFFKPLPLQRFYVLLPDFSGHWRMQFALMLSALLGLTLAPDIVENLRGISYKTRARGWCPGRGALVLGAAFVTLVLSAYGGNIFFIGWRPASSSAIALLKSAAVHFAILTPCAALALRPVFKRNLLTPLLASLLVATELVAAFALARFTGLSAIYSDDHPSFLFRLAEFWGAFPWRENYVPHWNAGVVNSVITSAGIPGYALFSAPLHLFSRQPHIYHTLAIIAFHIFFVPWLAVWGFRACRHDWPTSLTGGLLVLFANRVFFTWILHFGTAGAGVSWAVTPAAFLFAYAIAEEGRTDWGTVAGLALTASLLCAWPQMWMFAVALALAVLSSSRHILAQGGWRRVLALAAAAAIVLLSVAHSLVAVAGSRELVEYVSEKPENVRGLAFLVAVGKNFCSIFSTDLVAQSNPLVLVFGLMGFWTMRPTAMRRWVAIVALLSAAFFSVGPVRYPNMQLYRMSIPLALTLAVPAAIRIGGVWRSSHLSAAPLQGAVAALLALGSISTARIYGAQGFSPFESMDPSIRDLASWIRECVPEGSRVAFAGRTVHAYGHGHVAYLPILANREMMACDYYDFPRGTFEPDFPPIAARSQKGGFSAYFAEHRVSHVVTCRQNYIEFFEANPDQYEPGPHFSYHHTTGDVEIRTYAVKNPPPREAGVRVTATFNHIDVAFDGNPPERITLAYHWHERLTVSPPAEILPQPTSTPGEAPFIELRPHGSTHVAIKYRSRF